MDLLTHDDSYDLSVFILWFQFSFLRQGGYFFPLVSVCWVAGWLNGLLLLVCKQDSK